jgi:aminoglycoside phosphotransferase (APT) family kinase protein
MAEHSVAQIDTGALADFLRRRLPGASGGLTVEKFSGGQSNPTYLLRAGPARYVLRKKPPGTLLKSAHAVEREFRVLQALESTGFPVPRAHLLCEDPAIVGTPFFIMDYVDGRIFWDPALPELSAPARFRIYDEANRALAALHRLDPAAIGLADFGRSGDYFLRQVSKWTQQYRASELQPIAEMHELMAWLGENVPKADGKVALVHGDYRLDNLIFDNHSERLIAVLDWELSTLGHPIADLAYQCMQLRLSHTGPFRGLGGLDRDGLGLPSEAAYIAAYRRRLDLPAIDGWPFYLAFSFFRLAAILQGVKRRAVEGNASNPERAHRMGEAVPVLARMAMTMIAAGPEERAGA